MGDDADVRFGRGGCDEESLARELAAVAICCVGLAGCIDHTDPTFYNDKSDNAVCAQYRFQAGWPDRLRAIRTVIDSRHLVRPEMWPQIDNRTVATGMTLCEAMAAWAGPHDVIKMVSGQTTYYKYIYVQPSGNKNWFYVENGYVTDIRVTSVR